VPSSGSFYNKVVQSNLVGLYIFVVITPWRWHLGAETCRSLCNVCHGYWITKCICWI